MTRLRAAAFALLIPTLVAAQDAHSTLTVGTATASRGMVAYGALVVPAGSDSGTSIGVIVIHGKEPGPIVSFVSGAHGTEYASLVALTRLAPHLDPTTMKGSAIIVPLVNVASFEQMTPHLNPIDRKSMNRLYPGDLAGTQTQRALAMLAKEVVAQSDVVVDLHGGDIDEDLRPYSYWFRTGDAARDTASKKLALAFGLDHIIVGNVDPANAALNRSLSGYALAQGKQSFVAEAGRAGLVLDPDVNALVNGSLNVLGAVGVITRKVTPVKKLYWLGEDKRVASPGGIMFYPTVARDTKVKEGQVIGHTTDFVGRPLADILAPQDGLVSFIRPVPSAQKGAGLVTITKILDAPGPYVRPQ